MLKLNNFLNANSQKISFGKTGKRIDNLKWEDPVSRPDEFVSTKKRITPHKKSQSVDVGKATAAVLTTAVLGLLAKNCSVKREDLGIPAPELTTNTAPTEIVEPQVESRNLLQPKAPPVVQKIAHAPVSPEWQQGQINDGNTPICTTIKRTDGNGNLSVELSALAQLDEREFQSTGTFINPVKNGAGYQSQGFHEYHPGHDYAAEIGTPLVASDGGIVVDKGWDDWGFGNCVAIAHKHNGQLKITVYGHMDSIPESITIGKKVKQGDVIGPMGTTGNSTGPHIHFEIQSVNPDGTYITNDPALAYGLTY